MPSRKKEPPVPPEPILAGPITVTPEQLAALHARYCRLAFDLALGELGSMRTALLGGTDAPSSLQGSVGFQEAVPWFDLAVTHFAEMAVECCKQPAQVLWQAELAESLATIREAIEAGWRA